ALALPIAVALFAWSELILRLWVGEEVLAGVPIFRIFLVFAIFAALLEIPITLLFGIGKIRFCVVVSVGMLATGVGLGAWACSRYGLVGLAVSYTVVQTVGTLLLFGQSLQVAQIPVRHWLRKAVAPAIGAALPTVLWFWASTHLVPHNLVGLIVSVAIGFVLFLALFAGQVGGLRKQSWQMRARRLLTEID
ncbi:MAG: polysaccharide biosynthesis C-terminal domain-containing protein, partial [Acidobacteria bacterium]|nr:polysaccharide biosynthesis C-terminal domain-containing protein [Acidobacteriota bacterium]